MLEKQRKGNWGSRSNNSPSHNIAPRHIISNNTSLSLLHSSIFSWTVCLCISLSDWKKYYSWAFDTKTSFSNLRTKSGLCQISVPLWHTERFSQRRNFLCPWKSLLLHCAGASNLTFSLQSGDKNISDCEDPSKLQSPSPDQPCRQAGWKCPSPVICTTVPRSTSLISLIFFLRGRLMPDQSDEGKSAFHFSGVKSLFHSKADSTPQLKSEQRGSAFVNIY